MDEYDKRKEKYMKGITKKIVSILLAVALVITSLQYTPKTVSAAENYSGLVFTEVTAAMDSDYAYCIVENTLTGFGYLNFYGTYFMQIVGDGNSKMNESTVTLDGKEVDATFAFDRGGSVTGFNVSTLADDAYYEISLTGETGTITFVLRKGNPPTGGEEPSEPISGDSTISSLDEIEDAYIYNFVEAGEGFIVGFKDPNEDAIKELPEGTEYTYKYVLNVNGTDIEVAEPGVAVDLSSLNLVDGTEYDVTMKSVYTEGETSIESPASVKTKFTYKTSASTVDANGIAQVFFTTSSNPIENLNVNGLYEGSDNNKPKIPTAIVVKDAEENVVAFNYGTANVRGNSTANAAKKPYNFKFNKGKDLFGMGKAKKWSLLANIFDKTLMRNQIGMDFQRSLEESQGTFADGTNKVFTSECQPVDLYIDGVYAGTYTLIESVETGSSRVDIDIDGVDEETNEIVDESKATSVTINETSYRLFDVLLELGNDNRLDDEAYYFKTNTETFAVNEPARENKNYDYAPDSTNKPEFVVLTQTYVKDFETALANNDYDLFSQYIDVDSFVDFYITSEYFMTKDIGFSSTRFYIKDGKMYAGPLWDLDLSSGNNGVNPSAENFYAQDSFRWFKNLMANETFAAKVKARYTELQPQIKALYATGGKVDQAYETVKNSAEANYTEAYAKGENKGWGYTFVYGNSGYFDQAILNLTIQQANTLYGVYGAVNVYNNYADYITEYKTWLKNRNEWLVERWDIELVTGLNKNSQGDVVVTWDAVNGATGYAITYTPAILPETAQLSVFDVSPIAALAELGETATVYIADGTTTSYNFSDNNIQLADNSKVTVAYTTDATVDATATYAEVLEEEATSEIALLNRVTVDGFNANIVTNVTNNGTAVAENVVLTMNDANGNEIETKTVEAIGVGITATVEWNREEIAGNYTYTIETGLLSSGVSYACDDITNLTYVEDANLTAQKDGATYAVVGKVPETDFKFNADGYWIETGAADQAIYVRLNGEVVASNESGNSAMNYTVRYADLEYDTTNVIQIEYVDKAADMVTMTTYIQTVYVKVGEKPAEEEPDLTTVIANAMADTANWIQTGGRNNGAVSNSARTLNYWIESSYYENGADNNGFFNGNIYGYYVTGTGVPYGGIENNTVKGEAFGISSELVRKGIDSVWISDGTTTEKLTDGTKDVYWNPSTDVFTITADRFILTGDETEKVYYVTVRLADGSDYSWPVKVTKLVEQEPTEVIGLGVISQVDSDVTFSWGQTNEQILSGQSYKVYIDGEFYQEYVGATQVEYAFSTTGEHTIKVTANLNGKETEGATLNITINSVGTPDLVVSEVKILTEGELLPGQTIQVQITVKNQGTADAKLATGFNNGQALTDGVTNPWSHIIVHLRQWKDGEAGDAQVAYSGLPLPMVGENYVLAAGAASSVTFNYTIPADADTVKYQIGGLADADNNIKDELDENNNKTFINLEIGEVVKIPEANLINDGNEISVSWDADANATGYTVSYVVDGVTYTTDTLTETTYNFTENNIVLDNNTKVTITAVDGDNDGTVIAEATALADLTIINMYASGTAYAGKTINITSTVKNIGTAKATSSIESERVVAVTITAVEFSAYNTADDGLLPNDTLNIVVGYTPKEKGTATVTGDVNDRGRIYETDRTPGPVDTADNNNRMSITMPVVEEGAVVLSPIEGTNNVLVTWKAAENTAVNEYVVAYTSNDIVKTSLDGDLVSLETNTMTYDEATNTYSATINAPLDNNTMVYVYAIDPIDNTLRTIVGADMALVDLVIESIGEPLGEVRIGYKFNIKVTIKNQGTAQVKGSTSEIVDEFYPYTIPVMVKWENAEGETFAIHDEYHLGLLAGASQVITFEELAPTKAGDIVFNFKADSHSWAEGVYDGFHAESDENNNIQQKTIKVLAKAQVREMDWTALYDSQDKDKDGNPVVHIANFTDWRNVEYKVLDTSINDMDFEDILTDFSGYGGSYISVRIDNAENHKMIEPDDTDILDESTATMYFMQVLKETVDNFSSTTIDYGEPRKKEDGVLNNFDTNTNGINLHTRSFAPGKHYILKVENGDGEFLTLALRVPGDLEKWVQAKGDANTDENALPFVYHRGDLEVTGGFYYDATDLGLALISAYNGNWLVLTTDGTKTLAPNENWKLEIQYASLDENGEFVPEISDEDLEHIEKDPGIITLVPTDGVLRREGENTVHVSLPYLIQQIPIHSMNGGATDSEYYLLKLYNDADSTEYINIPVRIIANIPEIEPITGLAASLRGEELGVAWDNPNAEYKYDVYIQYECTGDYVLLKENATVEDVYSIDDKYFDVNNNIKVVATWCEQTTEAVYEWKTDLGDDLPGAEPPAREDKWVLINGEYNLPVTDHLKGNGATVNANIYYYTDVDISNVVGYNGAYIAINGNEDYFAGAETKLYVQKDGETPLVLEATRIYDKLYPGQIQVDASKMFETYGTYAEGYTWDGTKTLYYTIRVVGEDGTSKDFYFKIVPNEPEQQVNDKGEWVPLKGASTLPVTFKYNHTYTAVDGTVVTEQKELPIDGYIEYYDHQSLTNTYTATGYNSYFVSLIGMTDIYSGAGTVKLGVANTGTFDNQDMIKEGGNAAEQTYTDAVIYDQLYPGEVQINAGQVFTVTNTTTYFMLKITGQTTSADGTTTETTKYLPIRITVETGDVEIRGFQMNTNTAKGAVSEFNPSFRVVSRAAKIMTKPSESLKEGDDSTKLYGVVNYGTIYAVDSSVTDAEMTLDNEGVRYVQATVAGTLQNWSGSADDADKDKYSYYALTFKSTTYYLDTLTFKYKLKAYAVLDDGTAVYQTKQMSETSIEDIAEELYNERMMFTEEAHEFLYNHVLNIIAITKNRDNIGQAMFNALQPTSTSDEKYVLMNNAYKDLFYYVKLTREYAYDRYSQRETFKSLTLYDADGDGTTDGATEEYLLHLLSEASQKEYNSVADWIDENVTDGFYEKVTWKGDDTTPGDVQ